MIGVLCENDPIICACCKHNESVDIDEKLVSTRFELLKMALVLALDYKSCISVQHAYLSRAHAQGVK